MHNRGIDIFYAQTFEGAIERCRLTEPAFTEMEEAIWRDRKLAIRKRNS